MSNVFLIADTHFGHRNILKAEPSRPGAGVHDINWHDQSLIFDWNARVGKKDVVWHLGDLAWTAEDIINVVPQLNGRIKLVLGNHDNVNPNLLLGAGIESLHGCVSWKREMLLTHMPTMFPSERYRLNIHGHTHSQRVGTNRHLCVSVERTGFQPIALDELEDS